MHYVHTVSTVYTPFFFLDPKPFVNSRPADPFQSSSQTLNLQMSRDASLYLNPCCCNSSVETSIQSQHPFYTLLLLL